MADKIAKAHELRSLLKSYVAQHGRVPTRDEFVSACPVKKNDLSDVGGFSVLVQGAGLSKSKQTKEEKFKYFKPKIDTLSVSNSIRIDLDSLFQRFGNPEFLRALAMPDTHLQHADPWALNCFLDVLFISKPHILIIMGDFLDAGGISHWPSNSLEPQRFIPEVIQARELLTLIRMMLPDTEIIYLEGNHEDWINQFIRHGQNPQLFDEICKIGMEINLAKLLELEKHKIKLYPMNQLVRIGDASFTHGMYTGDNHAKTHLMKIKSSVFIGHTHDTKSFVETSIDGPVIAQALGCLPRLDPKFLRGLLNNWEHAFGDFAFFKDGSFTHTVPKIIKGKTVVGGKLYTA